MCRYLLYSTHHATRFCWGFRRFRCVTLGGYLGGFHPKCLFTGIRAFLDKSAARYPSQVCQVQVNYAFAPLTYAPRIWYNPHLALVPATVPGERTGQNRRTHGLPSSGIDAGLRA